MVRAQIVDVDLIISAFLFFIFLTALIQITNSYLPRISNFLLSEARQKELLIFSSQYLKSDMSLEDLSNLASLPLRDRRVEVGYVILGFEMPFKDKYTELSGKYLYIWRDWDSIEIRIATDTSEFWANFSLEFPGYVKTQYFSSNLEEGVDSIQEISRVYGKSLVFSIRSNRSVEKIIRVLTFSPKGFLVKIGRIKTDQGDLNILIGDTRYEYHYSFPGGLLEHYYGLIYYSILHTEKSSFPIEIELRLWYK